jgi:hypothetical protein
MKDELFIGVKTQSPMNKWMVYKSILCKQESDGWMCYRSGTQVSARGKTKEEACSELAIKLKIKSWE